MKNYTAGKNDNEVRASRFVEKVCPQIPTSILYKSFRKKRIKINGKKANPDDRIATGDIIELYLNDEFFTENSKPKQHKTEKKMQPINILWQDANIALLHKAPGILCHSDNTKDTSLQEIFLHHLVQTGEYNPSQENTFVPALCNRLDRGSEGIVVAAKNYSALKEMNEIIKNHLLTKKYLCVTLGTPPNGTHTAFLQRDKLTKKVTVTSAHTENSKPIETGIKMLAYNKAFAFCEINLISGRTHQIRAHLAFLGFPILGDTKYGNPHINHKLHIKNQLLAANSISFSGLIGNDSKFNYLKGQSFSLESSSVANYWNANCSE